MLSWKRHIDYESAEDVNNCLYVFKKDGKYLYIGKAKKFGGPSGRYAYGYRYLVDALIKTGATLYTAELTSKQWTLVRDYENTLLSLKKAEESANRRRIKNINIVIGLAGP